MINMDNFKEILPLIKEELSDKTKEKIKMSVRENIVCNDESEEIRMKTKKTRIRPLIIAAAIVAISAASVVSVNAATDGALFSKIKVIINGEEVEKEAEIIDNGDGSITYQFNVDEDESNMSIEFNDEVINET